MSSQYAKTRKHEQLSMELDPLCMFCMLVAAYTHKC